MRKYGITLVLGLLFCSWTQWAQAHVPYLERYDFTEKRPFIVDDVEQSIAVYSWLDSEDDLDFFQFDVSEPVRLFVEVILPVCPSYVNFRPWFAIIGPGLPPPLYELPIDLPEGYGAVVMADEDTGEPRERFYEPFGGKWYFQGPQFDEIVESAGEWAVIYWDPTGHRGDYVAVIGTEERFEGQDILRVLINTPIIRQDGELHVPCGPP